MEEVYFRRIMSTVVIAILAVLFFLIVRPIITSIIIGLILAFLFIPIYNWLYKKTKMKNFSAGIICFVFMLLIILPVWFFTPIVVEQTFKFYQVAQQIDFAKPLNTIFPSLFASNQFSSEVASIVKSFVSKSINSLMNSLSQIILNFPKIFLQFVVVFFTFFFTLKDNDKFISYVKSLLPFSKDVEKKIFDSSAKITIAVIYGQILIGILQGFVVGIGFFIFGVPNATLLTLLACLAGVFPIIGTTIVWLPVVIYLLLASNTFPALGIILFGMTSTYMDNFMRPLFVSKRTNLPSSLILIGMIGGIFFFGILGLILGPLIIAYLLIILEIYRNKSSASILTNY